jgi:quercetin dioxygenase-like cupin family protein
MLRQETGKAESAASESFLSVEASFQKRRGLSIKPPKKVEADASKMASLVDYQEGAVVSRTIIDRKVGTVTLFAFDEGQGLSEHTAPYDALVHVLEGEAEVIVSSRTVQVKEGEMIILPANKPHAVKAPKRFKMLLTMIRSKS